MAKRKLNERQLAAIAILAQPDRGGLKYEEVAEKVGVTYMTLYRWRQLDEFNEELKKQVLRNAVDDLPKIYSAVPKHIIEDGNAAMFRTFIQSLGMLKEQVEIDNKNDSNVELEEMKAKLEEFRKRNGDGTDA